MRISSKLAVAASLALTSHIGLAALSPDEPLEPAAQASIIQLSAFWPSVDPVIDYVGENYGSLIVTSELWWTYENSTNIIPAERVLVEWYECTRSKLAMDYEPDQSADVARNADGCVLVVDQAFMNDDDQDGVSEATYEGDTNGLFIRAKLTVDPLSEDPVKYNPVDDYWTPTRLLKIEEVTAPGFRGPVIGSIDFRPPQSEEDPTEAETPSDNKPRPGGDIVMRGPRVGEIEEAEIDDKPAPVTPEDEETVIIKIPEDATPGVKDIRVRGPFGELVIQDGIEIFPPEEIQVAEDEEVPGFTATKPADCSPTDTAFSAWTQDQLDGSVLFFAKNVVGAGEVSFKQNKNLLKSLQAETEDNPNIRWGNCSPYFLHRFTREDIKNGLEVYLDGTRQWRAAYSGTGLQ